MTADSHLNYLREAYDLIVLTFFNKIIAFLQTVLYY